MELLDKRYGQNSKNWRNQLFREVLLAAFKMPSIPLLEISEPSSTALLVPSDKCSMGPPMQVDLLEALKVYSMVWLPQFKIFSRVFLELLVVFWVKKEEYDKFWIKKTFVRIYPIIILNIFLFIKSIFIFKSYYLSINFHANFLFLNREPTPSALIVTITLLSSIWAHKKCKYIVYIIVDV